VTAGAIAGIALLNGGEEIAVANADLTTGGLLTFERTARGANAGVVGKRIPRTHGLQAAVRKTPPSMLSDVLI
jgi:hypothetical protein